MALPPLNYFYSFEGKSKPSWAAAHQQIMKIGAVRGELVEPPFDRLRVNGISLFSEQKGSTPYHASILS